MRFSAAGYGKRTRRILISLALPLAWLTVLEWSTRAVVRAYGDSLQAARLILEPDPALGWKQRPNLDTVFRGRPLRTDEWGFRSDLRAGQRARVWILGPSSSFGWGVGQGETYADFLARRLEAPVLNAGEIGYSIVQGKRLFSELRDSIRMPPPSIVVLGYGINDVDHFRFFGRNGPSDEEMFRDGRWGAPLANEFAIGAVFARAWEEAALYRHCGLPEPPRQRVSVDEFRSRLGAFVDEIREGGSIPVLLTTAFSPRIPRGSSLDPGLSDLLYLRSARASREGRCGASRKLFREARQAETARLLEQVRRINAVVSQVAASKRVSLVDVASLLGAPNANANFVDPVHFSVTGNRKVANAIARALSPGAPGPVEGSPRSASRRSAREPLH